MHDALLVRRLQRFGNLICDTQRFIDPDWLVETEVDAVVEGG